MSGFLTSILVGFQYFLYLDDSLPSLPVSSSLSFNEKIAWLGRQELASCDVIASGSSITLNNINSDIIKGGLKERGYINISSWGMSIAENMDWLKSFFKVCKPKVLLIGTSANDFHHVSSAEKNIDYALLSEILNHDRAESSYLDIRHIYYNILNMNKVDDERVDTAVTGSLFFDHSGGVPLAYKDWSKDKRWNKGLVDGDSISESNYTALLELANFLKAEGIKLVLVQTPIRVDALKLRGEYFYQHVERLKAISLSAEFVFIDALELDLASKYFADTSHLNLEGAKILSQHILSNSNFQLLTEL